MMAIAAFWLNIPGKGKMNGEMIFYFPGKAAGGSVCQLKRQYAHSAVKLQPSDEEGQLGVGFLNHVKALKRK